MSLSGSSRRAGDVWSAGPLPERDRSNAANAGDRISRSTPLTRSRQIGCEESLCTVPLYGGDFFWCCCQLEISSEVVNFTMFLYEDFFRRKPFPKTQNLKPEPQTLNLKPQTLNPEP